MACAGQLLGLFPIPTPVGPLRRQCLCSQFARFWAPEKADEGRNEISGILFRLINTASMAESALCKG